MEDRTCHGPLPAIDLEVGRKRSLIVGGACAHAGLPWFRFVGLTVVELAVVDRAIVDLLVDRRSLQALWLQRSQVRQRSMDLLGSECIDARAISR